MCSPVAVGPEAAPPAQQAQAGGALTVLSRVLFGVALAVFFAYFLIYLNYAVSLFRFPFDYDQGEGFELNDSILFARGEWPYRDNEVYPFYASNYPPLFHLLLVPLIWIFGPAYWTGRLLSFLATLVTAGAIGWAVWRECGRREVAALSGLAFLASNYVYHIGPLFRQHMTMVMFETLAILTLAAIDRPGGDSAARRPWPARLVRRLTLALLFLLLAGYTKQLAISTVIAALVFLFLRGPRRAAFAAAGMAVVAGAIFLAINQATHGQWWLNIILANVNEYEIARAVTLYRQWFSLHFLLILAATAWLLYEIYWARLSAYSIWFAFAVGNAALSGKWGAGESYFTTAVAAACVCSGLAFGRLWNAARDWPPRWAALLAVLLPVLYLGQAARLLHLPTTGPVFAPVARALGLPVDLAYYDSQGYTQLGRAAGRGGHRRRGAHPGVRAGVARPGVDRGSGFPNPGRQRRGDEPDAVAQPVQEQSIRSDEPDERDWRASVRGGGVARAVLSRAGAGRYRRGLRAGGGRADERVYVSRAQAEAVRPPNGNPLYQLPERQPRGR